MTDMSGKLDKLITAVIGDEKFGQDGLVSRVAETERDLHALKIGYSKHEAVTKDRTKRQNIFIGLAALCLVVIQIIISLIQ